MILHGRFPASSTRPSLRSSPTRPVVLFTVHPHAYREFHVGHIGKVAEAVKDFLLPVGEVLGQERVGVEASVRDAHGRVVRLQPMILLAVRPFPGAF